MFGRNFKVPEMPLQLIPKAQPAPDPPGASRFQLRPHEYLGIGPPLPIASLVDNKFVPQSGVVSPFPSASSSNAPTVIVKSPYSDGLWQLEKQANSGGDRKKKVQKKVKERVVKAEEIVGHKGDEDIDHLLAFVEGEEHKKDLKLKKEAKRVKGRNNAGAKRRNSVSTTVSSSASCGEFTPLAQTPEPESVMSSSPTPSQVDHDQSMPLALPTNNYLSFESLLSGLVNAEVPFPSPLEPAKSAMQAGDSILPAVNKATSPERNAGGGKTDKKQDHSGSSVRTMVEPSKSESPRVAHCDTIPAALESKQRKQSLTEKNKPATGSFSRHKESEEPFVLVQCKRNRDTKKPSNSPPGKENSDRPPMEPKFKENVYQKPRKTEWRRSPGLPPPGLENSVGSSEWKNTAIRATPAFVPASAPVSILSIPPKLVPSPTVVTASPTTQSRIARSYASSVASVVTVVTTFKKDVDFPVLSPPPSPQVSKTIPVNSPLSDGTPEMPKTQDKITDNSIKNDQENGASKQLQFPSNLSHEKDEPVIFYGAKFESSHLSAGQKIGVDFGLGKIAGCDNGPESSVSSTATQVPEEPGSLQQAPTQNDMASASKSLVDEAPPKIDVTKLFISSTEKINVPESLNRASVFMDTYASRLKKLCKEGKLSCHRVA